jgi:dihydrofolate reductase
MKVSLIVAVTSAGVIGRSGRLPWRLSADLRRFKRLTMGHHIIMGRKTFDSIGRVLPGRTTVVVSRQRELVIPGVQVVGSLEAALRAAEEDPEVFVIGGSDIFRLALKRADRIYQTLVHAHVAGDVHFPQLDPGQWELVEQQYHQADERNQFDFSFRVLERIRPADEADGC